MLAIIWATLLIKLYSTYENEGNYRTMPYIFWYTANILILFPNC